MLAFNLLLLVLAAGPADRAPEPVELLATITIPSDARDRSGLSGVLGSGTPADQLGSMGSGIAYTGVGNRYLMVADRGPRDGADAFRCRWHEVEIAPPNPSTPASDPAPGTPAAWTFTLLSTTLMSDLDGVDFIGSRRCTPPRAAGRGAGSIRSACACCPARAGSPAMS